MRNRFRYLLPILDHLGALCWIFGFVMLSPLLIMLVEAPGRRAEVSAACFVVPAILGVSVGALLKRRLGTRPLDGRGAMLLCALGWIVISALGAAPFYMARHEIQYPGEAPIGFLDAYFETVSGFTTTGITVLHGLDAMPGSILFWRSLIQWLGGLGILTFFIAIISVGGTAHRLYRAESHKIFSKRLAPGLLHSLKILWAIYIAYTLLIAALLALEGMGLFDAVCHALTTLSTGGFSPYDASIEYFSRPAYPHHIAIEYTLIFGMMLGGMNFFVHHRLFRGDVRALWDSFEVRLWWLIVFGATALVAVDRFSENNWRHLEETLRTALFQVMAIGTTTGFATRDINTDYFPALSKQIFLVLMVIGGCVGSTGGGIKVLRIGILFKMVGRQLRRLVHGPSVTNMVVVDGERIESEEVRRIAALFFAWVVLLLLGGAVTAALTNLGAMESASGMFSALGNIEPCYISGPEMRALPPLVKATYIFGMLAGRLEIVPVLLLFSRRAWR